MNPGGGGCSELRSHHCTLAWVTQQDSVSKKKVVLKYGSPGLVVVGKMIFAGTPAKIFVILIVLQVFQSVLENNASNMD